LKNILDERWAGNFVSFFETFLQIGVRLVLGFGFGNNYCRADVEALLLCFSKKYWIKNEQEILFCFSKLFYKSVFH
jgi:hypothetical protein